MRTVSVKIEGISPLMGGRYYEQDFPRNPKEPYDDYEKRTWKNRLHTNSEGHVILPPDSFRQAVIAQAKRMSIKKKGAQTYTKDFKSGLLSGSDYVNLIEPGSGNKIHQQDIKGTTRFVPSDGVSGSGKRVMKTFPLVEKWTAEVELHILDDGLPQDVVESVIAESGRFTGLGAMRPSNGGTHGRFKIKEFVWK